jgi:hypothetical protein
MYRLRRVGKRNNRRERHVAKQPASVTADSMRWLVGAMAAVVGRVLDLFTPAERWNDFAAPGLAAEYGVRGRTPVKLYSA